MTTNIINHFYADDLEVTIQQQGAGRPVLLLHGGGGPPSMGPLPSTRSEDFEVIAPVHPGFSGTPRPSMGTSRAVSLAAVDVLEGASRELKRRNGERHALEHTSDAAVVAAEFVDDLGVEVCGGCGHWAPIGRSGSAGS
jgi:pimeloyl-ACP methyl ester carboxylesterase